MVVQVLLWVLCVSMLLLWWIKKRREDEIAPPTYPGALPLLGHSLMLLGDGTHLWKTLTKASKYALKTGGVTRVFVITKPFYFITDIEDFTTLMNTCYEKSFLQDFAKEWVGNGLVTANAVSWKKSRKQFGPFFTQRALYRFLDIFNSQSRRLVDRLAAKSGAGEFDHYSYIIDNLLQTVNQTTLGVKLEDSNMFDKNYAREIYNLLDTYVERLQKVWLKLPFLYNRSDLKRRQDRVINKAKAISYEVIKKRRIEFEENARNGNVTENVKNVLDFVLETFGNDENFTDNDIREHLETFIFGSFHTTGSEMVLALKCIGSNPEVQEKLYKEINDIFGNTERDVEKEDLSRLVYLDAVIKETVRLYPVVPFIERDAHTNIKLRNYTIPQGTTCIASIYALNRDRIWGEDAEQYRPDRWLETNRPSDSMFAGFSLGRRNCIGMQYALTVMKTMLVHILRCYRVGADKTEPVLKFNTYLRPIAGHQITLELRS